MSKDRNTFAKRQREMEKKRKADQKRTAKRDRKDTTTTTTLSRDPDSPLPLSIRERAVLGVFRRYLMSEGQMLCFSGPEFQSHHPSLAALTEKGLLNAERFNGGYSLTEEGYAAMKGQA